MALSSILRVTSGYVASLVILPLLSILEQKVTYMLLPVLTINWSKGRRYFFLQIP